MQISDLVGQYSRNVANGTEELHGAQSVQKLVSTIGDLSAGSIFEGTINSVRGGKVTLALGNGQTITARLDGKMDLQQGSSMFFQVRRLINLEIFKYLSNLIISTSYNAGKFCLQTLVPCGIIVQIILDRKKAPFPLLGGFGFRCSSFLLLFLLDIF